MIFCSSISPYLFLFDFLLKFDVSIYYSYVYVRLPTLCVSEDLIAKDGKQGRVGILQGKSVKTSTGNLT